MNAITITGQERFEIKVRSEYIRHFGFEECALFGLIEAVASGRSEVWVSLSEVQIEKFTGIAARKQKRVILSLVDLGLIAYGHDMHPDRDHNAAFMITCELGESTATEIIEQATGEDK